MASLGNSTDAHLTHTAVRYRRKISSQESHIYEDTEDFYDVDEYVPSSPFMEEVTTTQKLALQGSTSHNSSPSKRVGKTPSPAKSVLRDNEGLTRAIEAMEASADKENQSTPNRDPFKSSSFDPDDTCVSTFSMVTPADMTRFAHLAMSPAKKSPSTTHSPTRSHQKPSTPRSGRQGTPRTVRATASSFEASPTPRRKANVESEEATTQLLDFTEQLNYAALQSPSRRRAAAATFRSPVRNESANLLDFDMPPAPTPRSLPTITARELESLKSSFASQMSSLKATIDGKDATIKSLIEAKDDAERRVGDTAEALRESQDACKALADEKEEWKTRDEQIAAHLQNVKDELVDREAETMDLRRRLEESEQQSREAELHVQDVEARMEEMRKDESTQGSSDAQKMQTPTRRTIDQAVENVTRELHSLYKNKHEAKVTALKKSYEKRWANTVRELRSTVEELQTENTDLRAGRDNTMSGLVPSMVARGTAVDAGTEMSPARKRRCVSPVGDDVSTKEPAEDQAPAATAQTEEAATKARREAEETAAEQMESLTVRIKVLEDDIAAARAQTESLRGELEISRAENSDLVAVVEEMLQLDPAAAGGAGGLSAAEEEPLLDERDFDGKEDEAGETDAEIPAVSKGHGRGDSDTDMFRVSVSEHSGATRTPAPSVSKASGLAKSGFGFSAAKAVPMNRSVSGGRSGVMSNIERMGRGRAAE